MFLARRAAPAILAAVVLVGCSKGAATRHESAVAAEHGAPTEDSASGSIDLGSAKYTVDKMSAMGSLTGTIKLEGNGVDDQASIANARDACGMRAIPDSTKASASVANAVVWLADPKSGKALPIEKRAELSSDDCLLEPAMQAVVVGSTVNVFNDDKAIHKLIFTRAGTNDTLTMMPFFNTGQVVASERLAKQPGIVEVRCAMHPWMHGYIVVLDHPYFDVTDDDGSFKIDSIAPGTYTLMVWRAGLARPIAQRVNIAANGTAHVALSINRATAH